MSGYGTENEADDCASESEAYTKSFCVVTDATDNNTALHDEAYASLSIICDDMKGVHELKLKVDTGASGNTLPVHVAKQMYGELWQSKVEPVLHTKLTAYNGGEIKCFGTLKILCQYNGCQWRKYGFYVVDVQGPAILGLRACGQMGLVTIHVVTHDVTQIAANTSTLNAAVNSIEDPQLQFPDQFDRIGSFQGKATLSPKPEARTSIDAPQSAVYI